jgi:DNA-binding CsgD family transcriptional regulator
MHYYPTISRREKEILRLVSYEHTAEEIAERLYISVNTVKTHKRNLSDKLDVKNMAGLVRKGFELGILESPQSRFV